MTCNDKSWRLHRNSLWQNRWEPTVPGNRCCSKKSSRWTRGCGPEEARWGCSPRWTDAGTCSAVWGHLRQAQPSELPAQAGNLDTCPSAQRFSGRCFRIQMKLLKWQVLCFGKNLKGGRVFNQANWGGGGQRGGRTSLLLFSTRWEKTLSFLPFWKLNPG